MGRGAVTGWEQGVERAFGVLPYVLLALSVAASLARSDQTTAGRLITVALAAVAAVWVLVLFTRRQQMTEQPIRLKIVYIVGLLVIAGLAMAHDGLFLMFAITGFAHAPMVLPTPLAFVGVGAMSFLINSIPFGFPDPTVEGLSLYIGVIGIQTLLVGGSGILGVKLTEQNEQRRRAVADLEAALQENAGLHAQLLIQAREAGVLDERHRMAREIHDTVAQGLTGIVTQLQAAGRARDREADWQRHLDNAAQLARESLSEARRSVQAVRPGALETAYLPDAITQVVDRWSAVNGVSAEVATTGTVRPLHPEVEVTLLRTAQETLANVAKHAAASRVVLTLSYMEDVVTLDVRDDGVGFAPAGEANGGFGLTGMRQRVQRLAGTLEVESEPGTGTAISASVPAILGGGVE